MGRILGAIVVVLAVAACGGEGDTTTSTVAATSTSAASTSSTATPSTSATPTTTASTTTEAPPALLGTEVLVAGPDGVVLVAPDGTSSLLVDAPATSAIDDLNGGVLFQMERWSRERRSIVYRVAPDGTAAIQMLVPTPEQGLALNGIAVDGDETFVYYTRNEGLTPEDSRETLRRYSLRTREVTELIETGGWEARSFPISVSASLILYNWGAEATTGMRFTDLQANAASVAADPDGEEGFFDCGICPRAGELSANGDRLAYIERRDAAQYVVIRHVASGAEIRLIELPEAPWSPWTLDLSATHLVVNRRGNDGIIDAWVYDLQKVVPEPVSVGVRGEAYLTLAPVGVTGPIPPP